MAPLPEWIICLRLIYVITIFTLGVSGNGVIILVQLKNRKKSSTDCLILAMAIFDFVLAGIVAPMAALQSFTEFWSQLSTDWACKFYQYVVFTSTFASTQLLAAVAFDRYRNTCKPHAQLFTPRTAVKLASFVTLNSMTICSILFFFAGVKKDDTCGIYENRRLEGIMFYISVATTFFVTMVILIICYSMVASTLHKRHRQKVQTKQTGPVSISTNTSRVSLFRKNNKVGVADATSSTNDDTLKNGQKPDDIQRREPKPGPSFMRDDRKPSTAKQESTERSPEIIRGNVKQSLGWDLNNRLTTPFFARDETKPMNKQQEQVESSSMSGISVSVKPPSAPFLSWQLSDRATCGPTTSVEGRTEDTSCGLSGVEDRKQETARKLTREERKINKTTKMMFLITVIYTVSWMTVWTTGAYTSIGENARSELGIGLSELFSLAYMINSVSNPILYILMSSLFRKRVRALFSKNAQSTTQ